MPRRIVDGPYDNNFGSTYLAARFIAFILNSRKTDPWNDKKDENYFKNLHMMRKLQY